MLSALLACQSDSRATMRTEFDTLPSGVVVARTTGATAGRAPGWSLEPVATIGSAEGADAFLFGRVAAVAVGIDNQIHVLEAQAREVRVFDLNGKHVRTIGGPGGGPGELTFPVGMTVDPSGHVWVSDEGAGKYIVYAPDGSLTREYRRPFRWVPLLRGGPRVSRDSSLLDFGELGGRRVAVRMLVDSVLLPTDTIILPAYDPPMFGRQLKSGERIGAFVPFGAQQVTAIGPSGEIWTGVGASTYRLARLRGEGDTVRVIEMDVLRAALTSQERATVDSAAAAAAGQGYAARPEEMPAYHPHFEGVVIDDRGNLWVRRVDPGVRQEGSGSRPALFDIFAEDGAYTGTLAAPVEADPAPSVGKGLLVGVRTDSAGAPVVEVYRLLFTKR